MLISPGPIGGFGLLGEGVVALEDESDVQLWMLCFDCEHFASIAGLEEAFALDDHTRLQEEVGRVFAFSHVGELLSLEEVSDSLLVQELGEPIFQTRSETSHQKS